MPSSLKWFALAVLALLGAHCSCQRPRILCQQVGTGCTNHDECCSFSCESASGSATNVCGCNPLSGGLCATSNDCCTGLRCNTSGTCETGCRGSGETCSSPSACCSGNCENGQCGPRIGCADQGQGCQDSNECCTGLQCQGSPGQC